MVGSCVVSKEAHKVQFFWIRTLESNRTPGPTESDSSVDSDSWVRTRSDSQVDSDSWITGCEPLLLTSA
jgi:hypothetical protein